MQALEKQMLQLVKDHQQQVKSLPELSQLQPQLLRKMGEKFKLSNEKVEAFMDKRLKNHLNSLSNGRRAQTQALDKQLKGVEELVVESQERCSKALVELREVLEIGGVARATDPQQETLVRVTSYVLHYLFICKLDQFLWTRVPGIDFDPYSSNPYFCGFM